MRRVFLLLSFALALSATALANSDFGGVGGFGTGFPGSFTGFDSQGFTLTMELNSVSMSNKTTTGALGTITITTGPVVQCGTGRCFFSGSVNILSSTAVSLFQGTFTNGSFIQETCRNAHSTCFTIDAFMSNAVLVADVVVSNNDRSRLTLSSNTIVASSVPEPGTLGLLGAGMVGLVGMIHRKVRKPA